MPTQRARLIRPMFLGPSNRAPLLCLRSVPRRARGAGRAGGEGSVWRRRSRCEHPTLGVVVIALGCERHNQVAREGVGRLDLINLHAGGVAPKFVCHLELVMYLHTTGGRRDEDRAIPLTRAPVDTDDGK